MLENFEKNIGYIFKDKNGNTVATVYLDSTTGNHYIK